MRVRASPALDAPRRGTLRGGTTVTTSRRLGDWVEIQSPRELAGSWVMADADPLGLGALMRPLGGSGGGGGRSALALGQGEARLATLSAHPLLSLLHYEYCLRGLPIVATEDACGLLGGGRAGVGLLAPRLRSMRGAAAARAATERPPSPPPTFDPTPEGYKPPKAFEAGDNILDLGKILRPKEYHAPPPPPPPPPTELKHLHELCLSCRRSRRRDGALVIGIPEDAVLCFSGGGRFETPPERCAILERRQLKLLRVVREEMAGMHTAHADYEARLEELCRQHSHIRQFVGRRRDMLSVYSNKELKEWFESGG